MLRILIDLPVTELCTAVRPGLSAVMWSCISCHSHTHSEATVAVYPHAETVEKWKLHLANSSPANNQLHNNDGQIRYIREHYYMLDEPKKMRGMTY